jgi:hypothetical protein
MATQLGYILQLLEQGAPAAGAAGAAAEDAASEDGNPASLDSCHELALEDLVADAAADAAASEQQLEGPAAGEGAAAGEALLCSCYLASEAQAAEEVQLLGRSMALRRSWAPGCGSAGGSLPQGSRLLASSLQLGGPVGWPALAPAGAEAAHALRSSAASPTTSCTATLGASHACSAVLGHEALQPEPFWPRAAAASAGPPPAGLPLSRPSTPGHHQAASGAGGVLGSGDQDLRSGDALAGLSPAPRRNTRSGTGADPRAHQQRSAAGRLMPPAAPVAPKGTRQPPQAAAHRSGHEQARLVRQAEAAAARAKLRLAGAGSGGARRPGGSSALQDDIGPEQYLQAFGARRQLPRTPDGKQK